MKDILVRLNDRATSLGAQASEIRGLLQEAARDIAHLRGAAPPMPLDAKNTDIVGVHIDALANLMARSARLTMAERVVEATKLVRHYPIGWAGTFITTQVEKRHWDKLSRLLQKYKNLSAENGSAL